MNKFVTLWILIYLVLQQQAWAVSGRLSFIRIQSSSDHQFHSATPTDLFEVEEDDYNDTSPVSQNHLRFSHRVIAGGASRALAQIILYPIDTLRTLAQTRDGKTLADVGMRALVRGCFTTSMFSLFMGSIQFSIFGHCRKHVGPLLASAAGAAASCIVSVPQEVIKQRLVTGIYPTFTHAVISIGRKEGLRGFYSAWKPTMARNVPTMIITFTTMDHLKAFRLKQNNTTELSMWENIAIGVSSAFVSGLATNPIDVIKTRMMTQASSIQKPYSSAMDCGWTILRTEGPWTFYAGFPQRATYMCLFWGMAFTLNAYFQDNLLLRQAKVKKQ